MSKAITMFSRGNEAAGKPLVNCVIPCHPHGRDGSRVTGASGPFL